MRPDPFLAIRASDNFQGVALLAKDETLQRLAAAWCKVERETPPLPGPGQEIDLRAFWNKTQVDFMGWAALAGVHVLLAIDGFKVLKGNDIILPDGTLNHVAESLLQKEAAGSLMAQFGIKPGDLKK